MGKKKDAQTEKKIMKIVYFDEETASDYIDIVNGGHLDWNEEEAKEKVAKIIAEIDAQVGGGMNFLSYFKAALQGNINSGINRESKSIVAKQLSNTLLTDYISTAISDSNIKKFSGVAYPAENSMSKYKMYSPYTIIFPKDQIPIDLEKLNEALENARGYYEMLLDDNAMGISVLRFNAKAFRNNYNLSDLTKMSLRFYAIKVGECTIDRLEMSKEFEFTKTPPTAESVLDVDGAFVPPSLSVYDVVLAGVENE